MEVIYTVNGKGNKHMRNVRVDVLARLGLMSLDGRRLVVAAWECDPVMPF